MKAIKRRPNYWDWFWTMLSARENYFPYQDRAERTALRNLDCDEQEKLFIAMEVAGAGIAAAIIICLFFHAYEIWYSILFSILFCMMWGMIMLLEYIPFRIYQKYSETDIEPDLEKKIAKKVKRNQISWVALPIVLIILETILRGSILG